ncbi:MAG: NADH-quinone oxidoreductase subunit NuoN [Actinomycetota bacterium]|nr:NADH-quinone oxidoreductase subunit NuoN [Actinomycetota bacterium]
MNTPEVQLVGIAPEIALVVTAFVILVMGATADRLVRPHLSYIATAGFVIALVLTAVAWADIKDAGPELHLAGMVAVDGFGTFVKFALGVFGLLTTWLGRDWLRSEEEEPKSSDDRRSSLIPGLDMEFYALVLFAVAGMMLMATSADLIMIFIALETFSIALYVLVGFRRRSMEGQESAMKYFLLGAFSSSFFLLGIALAYGATGSTRLYSTAADAPSLVDHLRSTGVENVELLVVGMGLLIVGLGFKIAAVPFHMWTPDAYQGAPSPVTGFMAAATKVAAFAAILRLFDVILLPLRDDWRPLLVGIAVLTMVVGSILAVVQEDLKRILAYSSIAHAGFLLTGVIATNDRGLSGTLFYLATYGLSVLGAFAIISIVGGRDEEDVRLTDYRGLFYERPLLAGALTLFLLSLAGVPLTSGFVGKLLVFGAAIEAGFAWLVVVGVLASAVAAFFYLRVLVVMYMEEPREQLAPGRPVFSTAVVGLTALATLGLGLFWSPLIELAQDATVFFRA